jgi:hypothetical protein
LNKTTSGRDQRRYMQVEGMAELTASENENTTLALTA